MSTEPHATKEHAQQATTEHLWSYAVGISNRANGVEGTDPDTGLRGREQSAPGTGVAGAWGNQRFILTARHVLDKAQIENLYFFVRPTGSLQERTGGPEQLIRNAHAPVPLDDATATIHRCDWEDLALITINNRRGSDLKLEFADLATSWADPALGETVVGVGYPVSNAPVFYGQKVGSEIRQAVLLQPTSFSGEVLPSSTGRYFNRFDPDRHYLIPYEGFTYGHRPEGISGAAVWVPASGEQQIIWAPKFTFAGICTDCYKNGSIEQVVKASTVRQFLTDVFGPVK